jgi:peptidoglycan/xylan/chitin deacetylase (PgdA/CDA1 family)
MTSTSAPHRLRSLAVRERSRALAWTKGGLYATIRRTGLAELAARTWARGRGGILVYHNPTPETLEAHLRYLAPRVAFVTLGTLVDALRDGAWDDLPPRPIAVTIDDGHAGNALLVDVFRRYGVRPTIFACSQIVGTRRRFWWTVAGIDKNGLQHVDNATRLAALAEHGFRQDEDGPGERQPLSLEELAWMSEFVDIESHTRFHPILPACDAEECRVELAESRRELTALTGRQVQHFAYPNGRYGEREVALLRELGYRSARTIELGWVDRDSDPFRLKMIGVPDDASVDLLAAQLAGIPGVRRLMFFR